MKYKVLLLALLLVVAPLGLRAQFEQGSITGTVIDSAGHPLVNATIDVRDVATNVVREAVTDGSGDYNIVAVRPGSYVITAKVAGFQAQSRKATVAVAQRLAMSFTMAVSATTSTVVVHAAANTIDTSTSEVSNLRPLHQIQSLPLNSRNFTQLVFLSPGVNNRGNSANSVNQGYTGGRGTNGSVIDGNAPEDMSYLLDGIQSMDNDANDIILFPPVDAIQEFKVQTSNAPAAFGGAPAIINVTYRSGTNAYHGTIYEFLRNSDLDAKNYFDSHTQPIPPFHMNEYGAAVGGPIILPRLFNGRNKVFFFLDFEGKRENQAQTYLSTAPTPAFVAGDFSALLPKTVIHMPGTTTPLPNNIVPTAQIDPTSANLAALYPAPNLPGLVSNYRFNGAVVNNISQGDARIDFHSGKYAIFGRYSKENPDTISPGYLPAPAIGGGPSRPGDTLVPATQVVLGYGRTIGTNMYYQIRLGYSRMQELIVDADSTRSNLAEQLGIPNANGGGAGGLTNISISGTVGLGDGSGNINKVNNNWEVAQAFNLQRGRHEFQLGVDYQSRRFAFDSPTWPTGTMDFTGVYTGYGFSDFLYGRPISSELDFTPFFSDQRFKTSFYFQDDFRATSKLTLNYGIRNDMVTPWTERSDRLAGFSPENGGALIPVGTAPFPGNHVTVGRYTNWGPRLGFAYALSPKTAIHGAVGIFYAFENDTSNLSQPRNAPFSGSFVRSNSANDYAAALPISAGFPAVRPTVFPTAGTNFVYYPRSYKNPSINEWNLNIERELSSQGVLSVAYVGQTASHVIATPNINLPLPGPGATASRRPFPNLADGTEICPCGNSNYNSLQASYIYRSQHGLFLQVAYTYSHSLDDTSGTGNTVAMQDPYDFRRFYGSSDYDLRHSLVISQTYDLPFGAGQKLVSGAHGIEQLLVGGWQINSIDTFQTGSPFTVTMSTSLLNSGTGVQWPNRIGSGKLASRGPRGWFNTADFVSPGLYTFGNSGRNILYGPSTRQIDLSLFKTIHLGKNASRYVQLRAETFNVLNTPQFNNPVSAIGNPAAGTITSAGAPLLFQRTSREIQLAAKLYF